MWSSLVHHAKKQFHMLSESIKNQPAQNNISHIRRLLVLMAVFIALVTFSHINGYKHPFYLLEPVQISDVAGIGSNGNLLRFSRRAPIIARCNQSYKVAFTFDDGPHPSYTPWIVKTLHQQRIKAGFFVAGTAIQTFLITHKKMNVHLVERPRLEFLLQQDYSLLESLFDGHDIYLHGWLHEQNNEMNLHTVVDNIATQLLEIGLLKGFKPIYRAPWGIGTSYDDILNNTLLPQILNWMGIIPAYWDIDTEDYRLKMGEKHLIRSTLRTICEVKGGFILMHDNRPVTSYSLDRMIRSIKASGHRVVSPSEIDSRWNDFKRIHRVRKYVEVLRQRVRAMQRNLTDTDAEIVFRPVEVSLSAYGNGNNLSSGIGAVTPFQGSITVFPNIDDV